ncbi:MAG: GNAT family N-acetyltransferase [Cyclobacteriaceae bacterium]
MRKIIVATFQDLPRLAQCHRAAFPQALSSVMGQQYVEKMLEWYLVDKRAFIFFMEEDHQCVGYCGGFKFDGTERVGSASSMIQYSYHQAVRTFITRPWLFIHPEFIPKYKLAVKNVWRRIKKTLRISEKTKTELQQLPSPHTGLIVIGVLPRVQGKGYGSLLLQEFERVSISLGYKTMMLTVRTDNNKAIKSYLRNGWRITQVEGKSSALEKHVE